MKYTGRISIMVIYVVVSASFKVSDYLELGNIPIYEFILSAIWTYPAWLCGLYVDKYKYYAQKLQKTEKELNELLEKRLEESEQRFKSLFVHHSEPIFTFNLDQRLIEANPAAENLLGFTINEFREKEWESMIDPEDLNRYKEHYQDAIVGKSQELTVSMIHKDGEKRVITLKIIPIIIDEQCIGIYEIAKDITESIIAEEMIRRSDKLAVIGQLAAGVAHEIRNPLTILKGFIQILESDIDRNYQELMISELDRINQIVSELLVLSKPQVIKYEVQDIKHILNPIISFLTSQANLKDIKINLHFDHQMPFIKCDENQLKQVFINLIKNAMEAMPDGGEITVKATTNHKQMISIQVIDEGIGIEKDKIPKLLEPFYTTKEDGTGLGLMVCQRIIEQHSGTLNITSQMNKGTTVEVCLPI